jgi:hypothetical protein
MAMIDPNVMKAVGEALESHAVTVEGGERVADALSRALGLSAADTLRWVECLTEGCPVEEANRRVGIADHRDQPLLVAIGRAVGRALGSVAAPEKNAGQKAS